MKKKEKVKKKQDMLEFSFKEFTPEEGRVYEVTVNKFREAVAAGKTLRQAYESMTVDDKELEKLIQADFLKIMIAERHFGMREPVEKLAKAFDISVELIQETIRRMLQEVGMTANQYARQAGMTPKTSD